MKYLYLESTTDHYKQTHFQDWQYIIYKPQSWKGFRAQRKTAQL